MENLKKEFDKELERKIAIRRISAAIRLTFISLAIMSVHWLLGTAVAPWSLVFPGGFIVMALFFFITGVIGFMKMDETE